MRRTLLQAVASVISDDEHGAHGSRAWSPASLEAQLSRPMSASPQFHRGGQRRDFCTSSRFGGKLLGNNTPSQLHLHHHTTTTPANTLLRRSLEIYAFPDICEDSDFLDGDLSIAHAIDQTAQASIHGTSPSGFIFLPTGRISVAEFEQLLK